LELFEKFITPLMLDRVVFATDERATDAKVLLVVAETTLANHPAIKNALERPPWLKRTQSWPPKALKDWEDLTREELKVWLGKSRCTWASWYCRSSLLEYECDLVTAHWADVPSDRHVLSKDRHSAIKDIIALETNTEERSAQSQEGGIVDGSVSPELFFFDVIYIFSARHNPNSPGVCGETSWRKLFHIDTL
jgi:hypothetical protein